MQGPRNHMDLNVYVLQLERLESIRESAFASSLERTDSKGSIVQTTSGRIEMPVTKHFSVVVDKDMFDKMQQRHMTSQFIVATG